MKLVTKKKFYKLGGIKATIPNVHYIQLVLDQKQDYQSQCLIFYDCQKKRLNFLINGLEIGCRSTMYSLRKPNQWF